jgi:enterochelin esterase family protein
MLLQQSPWVPSIDMRMDRLIAEGSPPMILVMPDCFTRLGGSQYLNSSALGRYEDYLLGEIVPYVDRTYRTVSGREGRGVMGKSSGGYGAIRLGLLRPDLFAALACHSGDMYFEYCYLPDFPRYLNALAKYEDDTQAWLGAFDAKEKKSREGVLALNVLAMAAAYSPNPAAPLGFDLPFDTGTGEMRLDVWERWLENDPVRMLDRRPDSLRSMALVFLDCGRRDQYSLHYGARIFVDRLRRLKVAHEYQEFDDDHMGLSYRYDVSLAKLARSLNACSA